MKVVIYRVTLLEPTLVTEMSRDPNSDVAAPYLPGSVLRGAIIGKYVAQQIALNKHYVFDANSSDVRKLFFDNQSRFLNGYYFLKDKRSLPTPRSWHQDKHEAATQTNHRRAEIYDLAIEEADKKIQMQNVGTPFFLQHANGSLVAPQRRISIHTARTRRFGRAVRPKNGNNFDKEKGDTDGAVYRYDSLAPEQTFSAAILCNDEADAAIFTAFLNGTSTDKETALLGGSRSGGYGLVRFHNYRGRGGIRLV